MTPNLLPDNAEYSGTTQHVSVEEHVNPTYGPLEPIAIVGMSLRFPQEATDPEAFWSMLLQKRCAMTDWPRDRLNLTAFHHPDKNRVGTVSVTHTLTELG